MISGTDSAGQDPLVAPEEARFLEGERQQKEASGDGSSGKTQGQAKNSVLVTTTTTDGDDPAASELAAAQQAEAWAFVYSQLARQLEYYFSEKNLSTDTYVQTLRQLNDGCVPVSILGNFAMVKRLVMSLTFVTDEPGRLAAVEEAARNHSDRLIVCLIDTKTGLRVADEESQDADSAAHRILAVGTVDNKPLVLDTSIPQPSSPIVKTIVLRDVETGVTPEEIQELFKSGGFPPVTSIQPDVANCW